MDIDQEGLAFVEQWEALRLKAYLDSGGVPTIGIGTIRYPDGTPVKMGDTCTEAQAREWLRHDMTSAVNTVNAHVTVPLTQAQFNALVSLAYNIGNFAFAGSTLVRLLNAGDYDGAANRFMDWKYDNGRIIPGLVNRRSDEQDLFRTPTPFDPTPPMDFGDKDPAKTKFDPA